MLFAFSEINARQLGTISAASNAIFGASAIRAKPIQAANRLPGTKRGAKSGAIK